MDLDSLALTVSCPLCGAEEYQPCVYIWPKGVRECFFPEGSNTCTLHSSGQHERLARVGTPTKVAHNSRKQYVYRRSVRRQRLTELHRLSDWLRRYGDIFKEGGEG